MAKLIDFINCAHAHTKLTQNLILAHMSSFLGQHELEMRSFEFILGQHERMMRFCVVRDTCSMFFMYKSLSPSSQFPVYTKPKHDLMLTTIVLF